MPDVLPIWIWHSNARLARRECLGHHSRTPDGVAVVLILLTLVKDVFCRAVWSPAHAGGPINADAAITHIAMTVLIPLLLPSNLNDSGEMPTS